MVRISFWEILVPYGLTNLIRNSSGEGTVEGYGSIGAGGASTVTAGTAASGYTFSGVQSFHIEHASGTGRGGKWELGSTLQNTGHAVTCYARGTPAGWYWACRTADGMWQHPTLMRQEGDWGYYGAYMNDTQSNGGVYLFMRTDSVVAADYRVDALMLYPGTIASTFFNHDTDGIGWSGTKYNSVTKRTDQDRSGGSVRDFYDAYGVLVNTVSGHGGPPLASTYSSRAMLDGAVWEQTRAIERPIQMGVTIQGTSLSDLHAKRNDFYYDIQRDRVYPPQPFLLRYTGAGRTVQIPVVLDGGLEGGELFGDAGGQIAETLPLRFMAEDPYWEELREEASGFDSYQNLAIEQIVAYKAPPKGTWSQTTGYWNTLGSPEFDDPAGAAYIDDIVEDSKGQVFLGGYFLNGGGDADADYAVYRNTAGTWGDVGVTFNGQVLCVAAMPDDTVWFGGEFTNAVDANGDYIVYRTPGGTMTSLGAGGGADGSVSALAFGNDGTLYAGGNFTAINGVAANRIAKRNPATGAWSALGSGLNGPCYEIVIDKVGNVYATGNFTTAGGSTANYIAKWNGTVWSAFSSEPNDYGIDMAIAPDGSLYLVGNFTACGSDTNCAYVAHWLGNQWVSLSTGANGQLQNVCIWENPWYKRGLGGPVYCVYVGGAATLVGVAPFFPGNLPYWDGTTWRPMPLSLPGTGQVMALYSKDSVLYIGHNGEGNALIMGVSPVGAVTNSGSSRAWPVIEIKRVGGTGGTVCQILNETTEHKILMDYGMGDGETITFDLRQGVKTIKTNFKTVSNPDGNILNNILAGSDLAEWCLMPGDNKVGVLCNLAGAPTMTVTMRWRIRHWSVDGGAS